MRDPAGHTLREATLASKVRAWKNIRKRQLKVSGAYLASRMGIRGAAAIKRSSAAWE